jgi:glycine hydroxymethyltransferase
MSDRAPAAPSTSPKRTPPQENFLFDDLLAEFDPELQALIELEEARQIDKLQMIASESLCPRPVLAALASPFINKYAEGYPSTRMSRSERLELDDVDRQLAFYNRYGDRRYYKGTEHCDLVESLAQTRCARLFENPNAPLRKIFVNVQPHSGAPANNAVFEIFLKPGDTLMGMHLAHGGHLTHGSPVNRSGKHFKVAAYALNPKTWRIDYDAIRTQALETRPKVIVAGASAYPWEIDWARLRAVADEVGAKLLADISHPAGLAAAGLFPNPVGLADVTMFTTHKTMCGPRGAVLITTDAETARRLDLAVFPGEQGGPHMNSIAAKAVAFKIASTDAFRRLQRRIVENAAALAEAFRRDGLPLAYGGTSTHLCLLDLREMRWPNGGRLTADVASNILDLCGITVNKNTLAGDANARSPSGLRFGTVILSQRGMGPRDIDTIASLVGRVLRAIEPFLVRGSAGRLTRGRIDFGLMREVRAEVERFTRAYPPYREAPASERPAPTSRIVLASGPPDGGTALYDLSDAPVVEVRGERAAAFLAHAASGAEGAVSFFAPDGSTVDEAIVVRAGPDARGRPTFRALGTDSRLLDWLRALSDGYIRIDAADIHSKAHGPVAVRDLTRARRVEDRLVHLALRGPRARALAGRDAVWVDGDTAHLLVDRASLPGRLRELEAAGATPTRGAPPRPRPAIDFSKPFFVGRDVILQKPGQRQPAESTPSIFEWKPPENAPPRRTPLLAHHKKLGAHLLPFGGYSMPGWYGRVADEHRAVREAAGLFDVGHMGVFDFTGEAAADFLDTVTTNFVHRLEPGQSQYTYVLDVDGRVMDDIIVYRMAPDRFVTVVNASNQDKLWAWFTGVAERRWAIDRNDPIRAAPGPVQIRNLKMVSAGDDARLDLAFQGRAARTVMERLVTDSAELGALRALRWFHHADVAVGGIRVTASRTGYTGESEGYELLVHPREAAKLWELLLEAGKDLGVRPCGLAARDSTRAEAGFPLYGHELAGEFDVIPLEAGYGSFVKRHKPFFVGKRAVMAREDETKFTIVRLRVKEEGGRAVRAGDPIVSPKGKVCGYVTSAVMVGRVQILLAYARRLHVKEEGAELGVARLSRKEGEASAAARPGLGEPIAATDAIVVMPRFARF